jgi:predicted permease
MLFVPAVYAGLALLLGFKGEASKVTFLQLSMPVAVLNYVIAKEFEFDADLVSQSIVFSTLSLLPLLFLYDRVMAILL